MRILWALTANGTKSSAAVALGNAFDFVTMDLDMFAQSESEAHASWFDWTSPSNGEVSHDERGDWFPAGFKTVASAASKLGSAGLVLILDRTARMRRQANASPIWQIASHSQKSIVVVPPPRRLASKASARRCRLGAIGRIHLSGTRTSPITHDPSRMSLRSDGGNQSCVPSRNV
jgi:hypothetical protein